MARFRGVFRTVGYEGKTAVFWTRGDFPLMTERTIFMMALEITDPAERETYLEQACSGDANLRRQVGASWQLMSARANSWTCPS